MSVFVYIACFCGSNSVTYLNWTLIIEWCVVKCGFKNGHQRGVVCLSEIGLCMFSNLC